MRRFASILLVDPRGWLLLQERDEHPVIDPGCWGFVGGHVDRDEEPEKGPTASSWRRPVSASGRPALSCGGIRVYHAACESFDDVFICTGARRR